MMFYTLFSAEIPSTSGIALLKEGTVEVKGIPGFGSNRIPALFGRYEMDDGSSVSIWAVNEILVFNPEKWKSEQKGDYLVQSAMGEEKLRIWIVMREIPMRQEMSGISRWFFVAEFGGNLPDSVCAVFFRGFISRTEFFFSSARRYSDLSFPATFSIAGK